MDNADARPPTDDAPEQEGDHEQRDEQEEDAFLSWPPPGLRRMQGDLWQIVKQTGLGGVLVVLPLLWATASQQEFWSLGPFGASWWVLLLTSGIGLLVLVNAFVALFRLLRRAARATDRGYGWVTVALVAVDSQRDAGFLLQGARAFSVLEPDERRRLILWRLISGAAYLAAVIWLPVGFAIGILLAARGLLSPSGLSLLTLAPAALLLVIGLLLRMADTRTVRRARREWFQQPWSQDLAMEEVGSWNQAFREQREPPVPDTGTAGTGGHLRTGAAVVLVLAVIVFVPFLTLAFTTAVGPMVASVSIPDFSATQERAATVEAYRPYTVEPDSSISPQRAGEMLHTLTFAGVDREPLDLEKPPATEYDEPWIPDLRGGPTGVFPARWSQDLMVRAADGLSAEERDFLARVDDHPALQVVRTLARAPALDVGSGRWALPFPEGTTVLDLPIPKMSALRQASWAMVGSAALATAEGRLEDAERTLRELISVGFLLGDNAPTVLDNLTGFVLINNGGEALESFYASTGRAQEARALRRARRSTERTSEMARVGAGAGLEGTLRQMPLVVENPAGIQGLRWEYFTLMNTLAPCLNTHKMVFGPGGDYEGWVARAHQNLVRWQSEEALFELARNGLFVGKGGTPGGSVLGTVMGLTLGGTGESGSCASFFSNLPGTEGVM